MKNLIFKLLIFIFLIGFPVRFTDARSGCCSHHGGVCDCGCCDGTSLSATCAPYYPSCNRPVYKSPVLSNTPTPTPTPKSTLITTPISSPKHSSLVLNTSNTNDSDTGETDNSGDWWTIVIFGIIGYVYYKFSKK